MPQTLAIHEHSPYNRALSYALLVTLNCLIKLWLIATKDTNNIYQPISACHRYTEHPQWHELTKLGMQVTIN